MGLGGSSMRGWTRLAWLTAIVQCPSLAMPAQCKGQELLLPLLSGVQVSVLPTLLHTTSEFKI